MKTILSTIVALAFIGAAYCQQGILLDKIPLDSLRLYVRYDTVFAATGNQKDLFTKAKLWLAQEFKDSKNAIQTEDEQSGSIIGKGSFLYTTTSYEAKKGKIKSLGTYNNVAKFTIKIFTKQDKVKLIISDIKTRSELLSMEMDFTSVDISNARDMDSKDLDKQAAGLTAYEQCSKIHNEIESLIRSFIRYMGAKAENDF
jgi:hypothetical protein